MIEELSAQFLAAQELAEQCTAASARIVDLEGERDTYRLIAVKTVQALRTVTVERDGLRVRVRQLLDVNRALRTGASRRAA